MKLHKYITINYVYHVNVYNTIDIPTDPISSYLTFHLNSYFGVLHSHSSSLCSPLSTVWDLEEGLGSIIIIIIITTIYIAQ